MARTPYNDPEAEAQYQDNSVENRNQQMAANASNATQGSSSAGVVKIGGAADPAQFMENVLRGAMHAGSRKALGVENTNKNVIKFPRGGNN